MRIYYKPESGPRREVRQPPPGSETVDVGGECPACGKPHVVAGRDMRTVNDRVYESDAYCAACDAHTGTLIADPETFFGISEDRAMLEFGRARVYY